MGPAIEQSTYVVNCAFLDEDGDAVVPTALTWSLTSLSGVVINDRSDVVVSSPSSSEDIVLSGDDLVISTIPSENSRVLTVEATYNSTLGDGLPLKQVLVFPVQNLVAVT